jgi:hypothetical protein
MVCGVAAITVAADGGALEDRAILLHQDIHVVERLVEVVVFDTGVQG